MQASAEQEYKIPKTWVGSEGENVLKLLSELMQVVTDLSNSCASHSHPYSWGDPAGAGTTGAPGQAEASMDTAVTAAP
ncbi:hypothetical protein [Veronia nyctiphanis]|uniref:hypothetical protein n=1 Tax=Veronia nyctiphanis TaxID=1278244 RepID=UPI001375B259|nr:hypothetical protein [Veronia nyctiphanis]